MSDFCFRLFVLRRKPPRFPDGYFSAVLHLHVRVHRLDSNRHMIDDDSLFLGSLVFKTGGPTFESLETEWERVLSRSQALAIIDISLVLGEHVSSFIVRHFEIPIRRSLDVLWPMVIAFVILRFDTRNLNVLCISILHTFVSLLKSSWGGIAAIGSYGGGAFGGLLGFGRGR